MSIRNSILKKVMLVLTIWSLMNLGYYVFIDRNIVIEYLWLAIAMVSGANWGYWSEAS